MAKKKTRPLLDIPEDEVLKLARLGCLNTGIADFFGCDQSTIGKRFSSILAKGRAGRKAKLRELQWRAAESGNVTMLIWLGKQDLGQTDKNEMEINANVNINFEKGFDGC